MKHLLLAILLGLSTSLFAKEINSKFQILPLPQKIEIISEDGISGSDLKFIVTDGAFDFPILPERVERLPRTSVAGAKGVHLILNSQNTPESIEGYTLKVTQKGVTIASRGKAGLFYGCQTLAQLIKDSENEGIKIPQMLLTDYPSIEFRAIHLDTKNHLDRIEYYYSLIDKLASYKINAIIWEIEDKLKYTRRPEIASPNAISIQEMQAICRYAHERNIEINPLVQGLGHAGFILKHHWELRESPGSDWEFCPSDPRTYELQFDLYRDAIEAMPYGKYLHVGGDEITAIGIDERCKATGKSPFELQMYWLKKVCDFAIDNGRTPIFWDDMPLKYGDIWALIQGSLSDEEVEKRWNTEKLDQAVNLFPKECIYMRWNYGDPTPLAHLKTLEWYNQAGLKVMAATAAATGSSPFMPRNNSLAINIKNFSTLVAKNELTGILATSWDDGSPHLETVVRGFIAQGEYGWNPNGRDVDAFKKAHAQREFGFTNGELNFLDKLEESASFFDKALAETGRRNPSWQVRSHTLIDLPNREKPGEWSKKYTERIEGAKKHAVTYQEVANAIQQALLKANGNRYTLEIYQQNNELFNYPAKLLLALHRYDTVDTEEEKREMLKRVEEVCNEFVLIRKQLEHVYSKTRFLEKPQGYIKDMNHHYHLAGLTLNNDWLFLYELPYTRQVINWIKRDI